VFIDGRARQVAGFAREPSDSQIDGDYGLAAKGRQLERARSCRCDVGVSVKEVSGRASLVCFSQSLQTRVVIGSDSPARAVYLKLYFDFQERVCLNLNLIRRSRVTFHNPSDIHRNCIPVSLR
jgi:hypothetical protein